MEVGHPEAWADQGASGREVAAVDGRVVGVAQMEERDGGRSPRWRRLASIAWSFTQLTETMAKLRPRKRRKRARKRTSRR
jgi:hypothetical protein